MFEISDVMPDGVSAEFISALADQSGSSSEPYIYTQ